MREKNRYIVITFHTTAEAIAMEKFCNQQSIPGRLIPVSREISVGCGLSWRLKKEDFQTFQKKMEEAELECEQVVELML